MREDFYRRVLGELVDGSPSRAVGEWMEHNFLPVEKWVPKQDKNLWLFSGHPDVGKTSLVRALSMYAEVFQQDPSTAWYDSWEDDKYGAWVVDEFTGQGVNWPRFNLVTGGFPCSLARRGKPDGVKNHNVPVVVLSNFSIGAVCAARSSAGGLLVRETTIRARFQYLKTWIRS
ncbi:MAG: hypothetical protein GY753_10315 [Gammaproteobacteria bacterium]|nr:hypothetical protein [Gammaproteobacteria bacterium]